jgi:hypothetical protein
MKKEIESGRITFPVEKKTDLNESDFKDEDTDSESSISTPAKWNKTNKEAPEENP